MTLEDALKFLVSAHTTSTGGSGYAVNIGVQPSAADLAQYNEAWGVVRESLAPKPQPSVADQLKHSADTLPNTDLLNISIGEALRSNQKAKREFVHPWRKGG
jgi:hypothetical protein